MKLRSPSERGSKAALNAGEAAELPLRLDWVLPRCDVTAGAAFRAEDAATAAADGGAADAAVRCMTCDRASGSTSSGLGERSTEGEVPDAREESTLARLGVVVVLGEPGPRRLRALLRGVSASTVSVSRSSAFVCA